ncbi:MAG: PLP-dependent lyase/thiolase [Clostridiaceae bacterium]|jgi:cysteine synthase|nr:PLP-dependent lyase/thiolase [Clostridia bacterium]MBP6161337.1 PLP-dependent lyase/thiolase [Clostridia bacterium]MBP6949355.1 PLP-dependent lyase/thiolase [Clostridia bacterium]NMA35238.1 PLP-dependent lyase/thiolase [Clostridiaceae bacterium]
MKDMTYGAVMDRQNDIMRQSLGINYDDYEGEGIAFDYEAMMHDVGITIDEVVRIQRDFGVGNTPLMDLKNVTALARKVSEPGYGARILIKDEAANPSGSFKARRAALSVWDAKRKGYKGVIAATSGNYGAAVASMAAKLGLKCIVLQECYDSELVGQPEILEKQRKCEAFGAEVVQTTVGPELFYLALRMLEETGFYNASLYSPSAIAGIETLGYEIARQCRDEYGLVPDVVLATHAGGGNLTGTARGLIKAGLVDTKVYAASVDLSGLSMASDRDFNRKSFTTGHTGFGIPFASLPDRSDVPRNAARALRYIDRYLLVKQGEVFYTTEMLATLEGLERGPAGNTSLAAAFALARTMPEDKTIVVQETEYTGAGKHPMAQLTFARQNGINVYIGDPEEEVPGESIVLPAHPSMIRVRDYDMSRLRASALRRLVADGGPWSESEIAYMAEELNLSIEETKAMLETL